MKEIVEKIIKTKTEGTHLFWVDMLVQKNKMEIYIDGDAGVSLEDCASLNKHLHSELEKLDIDTGKYIIEISSPGLDRSVQELREFKKNVGRRMKVRNKQNKYMNGEVAFVGAQGIMLMSGSQNKKMEFIKFSEITEAKAVI